MKKISLILVYFFVSTNILIASDYSSEPKAFVQELVSEAIVVLSDKTKSEEDKIIFIEKIALDNVDINALGLYTLGEVRKTTDKSNLKIYQAAFEKYFLKSLTSRLTDYSSNKFEVIESEIKSSNYTIVKSKILASENQPEIKIDWRIYTKNKDKPFIRDLIIEGLSLARTQKEEFNSVLQSNNNDITELFKTLKSFIKN